MPRHKFYWSLFLPIENSMTNLFELRRIMFVWQNIHYDHNRLLY